MKPLDREGAKNNPSQAVAQPFADSSNMQGQGDTEMTDYTRATYVKMPGDKPLGLELKQFEAESANLA